jgi:cell division protein FtsI (penicillin-binding protein 3)
MVKSVTVSEATQLRVPSLVGLSVRDVIVQAASAGLDVDVTGSGTVREQAPAAGTMVAEGTKIVVKCSR